MKNLDLGCVLAFIGDLHGAVNIVVPFNLTGQAEVQAEGLSVHLDSSIERAANGSARVSTLTCHSTIRAVDVINHNGGLFGLAVTVFKQGVSDNVRLLLQGLICKKVRKYLDEDLNEKLAEVQTKSPLNEAIETNAVRATRLSPAVGGVTLGSLFGKSISNDFFIDFRLREDPYCSWNTVDLACAGEISYKGEGGTPFGPPPIQWLRTQQRLIRLHLTPSTGGVAQFLRTSCEGSFCLADLVPQLAETYPNHTLELSLAATRAPAVLFSEKKGGVISVNLGGVIVVFVSDGSRRKQAAVLDMDVVADAKLNLQNQNVSGSVELTKFDLTSRSATIKISQDELSDIAILVSQMVENMLNEMLSNGFPLPLPH
ncbi:LBP / BPI / CETP family protein, partial [Oesophagostomum dentatum]